MFRLIKFAFFFYSTEWSDAPTATGVIQAFMWSLPKELFLVLCPANPYAHAHRRQAFPLCSLPKSFHHQREPKGKYFMRETSPLLVQRFLANETRPVTYVMIACN